MSYSDYGLDPIKKSKDDPGTGVSYLCLWCETHMSKGFYLCFVNWIICGQCIEAGLRYFNESKYLSVVTCFKCSKNHIHVFCSPTGCYMPICLDCSKWGQDVLKNHALDNSDLAT